MKIFTFDFYTRGKHYNLDVFADSEEEALQKAKQELVYYFNDTNLKFRGCISSREFDFKKSNFKMVQKEYNRAVAINKRLEELEKVKKEIERTANHKLSYLYSRCDGSYGICSEYIMDYIGRTLDHHDKMIREEIDAEIEKLKKEIEEL